MRNSVMPTLSTELASPPYTPQHHPNATEAWAGKSVDTPSGSAGHVKWERTLHQPTPQRHDSHTQSASQPWHLPPLSTPHGPQFPTPKGQTWLLPRRLLPVCSVTKQCHDAHCWGLGGSKRSRAPSTSLQSAWGLGQDLISRRNYLWGIIAVLNCPRRLPRY